MNSQYENHHLRRQPPPEPTLTPYEETLRAEVIYLHSLWHQGPPPPKYPPYNPQFTIYTNSIYDPPPSHYHHHHRASYPLPSRELHAVTNPRPFKKRKKRKGSMTVHVSDSDSGPEWPVMSPVPESQGWPAFKDSDRPAKPVSEEVQTLVSDKGMQKDVVESCRKYFYGKMGPGSEKGEDGDEEYLSDEDEEGEDDDDDDDEGEGRDFKFLLNLFVESRELREYYEKKQESGALYCLVCGGIGVKVWKSFRGCLSLVQHCNGIEKTKRRRAHRALAQVVCKVLGWDFDRLPTVVLKGEPLGRSLTTSGLEQVEKDEKNMDHGSGCVESGNASDKFVIEEVSDDAKKKGKMVDSEIRPGDRVTDKLVGDHGNGVDATGGCGEPVNHEALSLENHGEEVNEGVHTLSVSAESGKEGNVDDPLANLKGDNDAGTGGVEHLHGRW